MKEKKNSQSFAAVAAVVLVIFVLYMILNTDKDKTIEDAPYVATVDPIVEIDTTAITVDANEVITAKNWDYTEDKDEMTGKKSYYAKCDSENKVNFDFPYDGGSSFTLVVRKNHTGTDVYLRVSKGQFLTSYDGSSMRVKFDEEQPITFTYNGTTDGSSDVIFIGSKSKFISKLKKAKKVSLEPEFYQAGRQIVIFNVEGLEWQH